MLGSSFRYDQIYKYQKYDFDHTLLGYLSQLSILYYWGLNFFIGNFRNNKNNELFTCQNFFPDCLFHSRFLLSSVVFMLTHSLICHFFNIMSERLERLKIKKSWRPNFERGESPPPPLPESQFSELIYFSREY